MKSQEQERSEALYAADVALGHLYQAQNQLQSAGHWGIADMLGGGGIVSMVKRGKMSDARGELKAAKSALQVFVKELRDVDGSSALDLDFSNLLTFADIFFDNTMFDVMSQFEISKAKKQVAYAIQEVEALKRDLQNY